MKNNKITIPIIAALVIAVISLGIAFAAFSATLTINGNATIEASSWDIHFSETEKTSTAGSGAAPAQGGVTITPTIESGSAHSLVSTLTRDTFTWSGTFRTPEDTLEYRFWIVNAGDYNADLSAPVVNTPVCKIGGTTQQDCPILYSVTKDGTTAFTGSDSLASGASQLVVVKAQLDPSYYSSDGTGLSNVDIDVSMYTVTFNYTQNGGATSGQSQSGGGSSSGGGQVYNFEVFIPAHNDEELGSMDAGFGTVDILQNYLEINTLPSGYLKREYDEVTEEELISLCINGNSTEECFTISDVDNLESSLASACSNLGFTFINEQYDSGFETGVICTKVVDGDTATLGIFSDTYGYKQLAYSYRNIACHITKYDSEGNNQYELDNYDCYYSAETGD